MLKKGFDVFLKMLSFLSPVLWLCGILFAVFVILCGFWFFRLKKEGHVYHPSGQVQPKKVGLLRKLLMIPRRYMLDRFERETGYFYPRGIHMFCGEQGSGKTVSAVEMMLRLRHQYPMSKMITNFAVEGEDDSLDEWQQMLTYTNGHQGVIVGIDEIQNWFMSGVNKLPEGMLEVATQNRKNNRILCCTAQVFTRVNKGLREQVTLVYNPHTFLGCFTVVVRRKPIFDSEGNLISLKYRGMYCFVHTDEIRNAFDTYKVIHTLAKEGFKEQPVQSVTNIYVESGKRK